MRPNRPTPGEPEAASASVVPAPPPPGGRDVPRIDAQGLFGPFQEIRIQHRGTEYRLRITRNEKLILTK